MQPQFLLSNSPFLHPSFSCFFFFFFFCFLHIGRSWVSEVGWWERKGASIIYDDELGQVKMHVMLTSLALFLEKQSKNSRFWSQKWVWHFKQRYYSIFTWNYLTIVGRSFDPYVVLMGGLNNRLRWRGLTLELTLTWITNLPCAFTSLWRRRRKGQHMFTETVEYDLVHLKETGNDISIVMQSTPVFGLISVDHSQLIYWLFELRIF